jgi:chromosome segregation ATPase
MLIADHNSYSQAKASENLYTEESKRRKEVEEELAKEKEELERINRECDEVMEELRIAEDQKSLLEKQIKESDQMVKELEQKIISAVGLLQNYKKEQDELQKERDNALKEVEELRRSQTEASGTHMSQFFTEFSLSEIEEATQHFDPSLKIGEGGYGSIYKGVLRQTQVAVKMLHSNSLQGPAEFQQEVAFYACFNFFQIVDLCMSYSHRACCGIDFLLSLNLNAN